MRYAIPLILGNLFDLFVAGRFISQRTLKTELPGIVLTEPLLRALGWSAMLLFEIPYHFPEKDKLFSA